MSNRLPIQDLDLFVWNNREVFIAFDTPDVRTNRNVARALEKLLAEIRRRGGTARVIEFPRQGERKVGLDDYLIQSSEIGLKQLMSLATDDLDTVAELNDSLAMVCKSSVATDISCLSPIALD